MRNARSEKCMHLWRVLSGSSARSWRLYRVSTGGGKQKVHGSERSVHGDARTRVDH